MSLWEQRFQFLLTLIFSLSMAPLFAQSPQTPSDSYVALGNQAVGKNDYDTAISDFTTAILLNPRNAWAYNCRAMAKGYKNDLNGAIADFRTALKISPNYANVYVNCGWFFQYYKHDLHVAIADYTEAIRLDPTNIDTYITRAEACLEQTNYVAAIADFTQCIQWQPTNAIYYSDRAEAEQKEAILIASPHNPGKRDDFADRALDDQRKAAALDSNYLSGLAEFECHQGQYQQGIADITEYIQQHPTNYGGWDFRALAWERLAFDYGRQDEVIKQKAALDDSLADWNQLVSMDTNNETRFRSYRADFYARNAQYTNASHDYQEAIRLAPTNYYCQVSYGAFLAMCPDPAFRDGAKALAITLKACAPVKDNLSADYLYPLAAAYAETGDFTNAVKFQEQAVARAKSEGYFDAAVADLQKRLISYQNGQPYHKFMGVR